MKHVFKAIYMGIKKKTTAKGGNFHGTCKSTFD
jgi:hypothetical protein